MDIETFGEHNPKYYEFLFEFITHPQVRTLTFHDLELGNIPVIDDIVPSSWSTDAQHLNNGIPYPLWNHPGNPLHALLLSHMDLVEVYVDKTIDKVGEYEIFETLFLKSQHSCQLWWADGDDGRWSPQMIRKGLNLQREVIRNSPADVKELSTRITQRIERTIQFVSINSES